MGDSIITNIIGFIHANLAISSIFGGLVLIYIIFELFNWLSSGKANQQHISVNQLVDFINHHRAVVIDIRPLEHYRAGHIIAAAQVDVADCHAEHKLIKTAKLKNRPIIIVDEQGKLAAQCVVNLYKSGLKTPLHYLRGGLAAWRANNMPLITDKANNNPKHNIIVYTREACPYCVSAKNLLHSKGQTYQEIKITGADTKEFQDMLKLSGGLKTVPQIFINDQHIGGFDALKALNDRGELDKILQNLHT